MTQVPSPPASGPAKTGGAFETPSPSDGSRRPAEAWEWIAAGILLAASALGLYARFDQLGVRQLAVDEYYFVTSVRSILEHGLPELLGGGYYVRGLVPQYLTAGSVIFFGDSGFAYRFPSVLFNLGAVAAAWVYARRHLPAALALLLPALLMVSSWEVEFSRFARMYAGLQFSTLLLLLAADRVLSGERHAARWLPAAVLLNVLMHALGVIFLPLLALPAVAAWARGQRLTGTARSWIGYVLASATVTLVTYVLGFSDLRNRGAGDRLPLDFSSAGGSPLREVTVVSEQVVLVGLGLVLLALVIRLVAAARQRERPDAPEAWGWAALLSGVLHWLLPLAACLVVLGGRYRVHRHPDRRLPLALGLAGALALVAWAAGTAAHPEVNTVRALLAWPDLVDPVINPWRHELPLMGALILAGLGAAVLLNLRAPLAELLRHPAAVLLYVLVVFGTLDSLYNSTRYLFFVYPVGLLVVLMVAAGLAHPRPAIGGGAVLLLFLGGGDFDPRHLAQVTSADVSWRTGPWEGRSGVWYARQDFASPARFADSVAAAEPGTRVLVVGLPAISEYLLGPHARFYGRDDPRFDNVSRLRGTVDLWSGQPLLSTAGDVRQFLAGAPGVLILRRSGEELPAAVATEVGAVPGDPAFESRDGRIEVLRGRTGSGEDSVENRSVPVVPRPQ